MKIAAIYYFAFYDSASIEARQITIRFLLVSLCVNSYTFIVRPSALKMLISQLKLFSIGYWQRTEYCRILFEIHQRSRVNKKKQIPRRRNRSNAFDGKYKLERTFKCFHFNFDDAVQHEHKQLTSQNVIGTF